MYELRDRQTIALSKFSFFFSFGSIGLDSIDRTTTRIRHAVVLDDNETDLCWL